MSYTTIAYLQTMLPRSITIGDSNLVSSPTINQPKSDTINIATAQRFLNLSSSHIDSRLRSIYICPLRMVKILEESISQNIPVGQNFLMVEDATKFNMDSVIRITDAISSETYRVNKIYDNDLNKIGISSNTTRNYFLANNPIVYLIEYPDPIPLICAQVAVGLMFDRIWTSEQSPDVSSYGKTCRTNGNNGIDDILAGIMPLTGQDHTGRRFHRTSVRDTWSTTAEIQHGRDKEV